LIAAIEAALAGCDALTAGASRARCTLWPKAGFKVNPRCLLVGEHCEKLESRNCALAHEQIVDNSLEGVKYYFDLLALIFQTLTVLLANPACKPIARRVRRASGEKTGEISVDVSFGVFMSEATKKRPLVAQLTTVLSYVYKIAKLGFDLYTLVHFGH
jgi:hypothetical protein